MSRQYKNSKDVPAEVLISRLNELKERIEELENALRRIEDINWGWDGDCGAQAIINDVLDT